MKGWPLRVTLALIAIGGVVATLRMDAMSRELCRIETFLQMEKPGLCKYHQ